MVQSISPQTTFDTYTTSLTHILLSLFIAVTLRDTKKDFSHSLSLSFAQFKNKNRIVIIMDNNNGLCYQETEVIYSLWVYSSKKWELDFVISENHFGFYPVK